MLSSGTGSGTAMRGSPSQHVAVERHVAGLEGVVELLAQPRLQLGAHAAHGERLLVLLQDAQRNVEAAQIGIDRGVHVRVLQLAGERAAVVAGGAMHLAERGRGGGRQLEVAKAALPVRAELARHAPAHEVSAPSAAPATAGSPARRRTRPAARRARSRAAAPP